MKNYKQPNWNSHFKKNTKNISNCNLCLEIGAFEGLTSNYIVDNLLSKEGKLICLDLLENQYLVDMFSSLDTNAGVARFIGDREFYYGDHAFYTQEMKNYNNVTVKALKSACKSYLKRENSHFISIWNKH